MCQLGGNSSRRISTFAAHQEICNKSEMKTFNRTRGRSWFGSSVFRWLEGKQVLKPHLNALWVAGLSFIIARMLTLFLLSPSPSRFKLRFQLNMLYWHESGEKNLRGTEMEMDTARAFVSLYLGFFLGLASFCWPCRVTLLKVKVWFNHRQRLFPQSSLCMSESGPFIPVRTHGWNVDS